MLRGLVVALSLALPAACLAGRIDAVKMEVLRSCGRNLDDKQALSMVKMMFFNCGAGQKVDTATGCKVRCLNENPGVIIGGRY